MENPNMDEDVSIITAKKMPRKVFPGREFHDVSHPRDLELKGVQVIIMFWGCTMGIIVI